jgi:hypothetical protein
VIFTHFIEFASMAGDDPNEAGLDVLQESAESVRPQVHDTGWGPGELEVLIAEGERSIEQDGTFDGDEAFLVRRQRRAQLRNQTP